MARAVTTLAVLATAAATVVTLPRLSMEAHSFNDIDTWPQLVKKGIHWFKVDISFCLRNVCETLSTFGQPGRGNESDCYVSRNAGQEYCCMCMRGDASTRPDLFSPFNTTADMLAYFASPQAQALYPKVGSGQKVMIALDFGGVNVDFFNATEAALLRTLLFTAHGIWTANNLSVSFYNDATMNGWFQALDQKCYAGNCTAEELALQALPYPSEGGDALPDAQSDPYGRYQILNSDERGVQADCNTSSWDASLPKADGNPYLWYEPSSQLDYALFYEAWATCPTVPADKRSTNTGLAIVTNQQPEMFEVYASSDINRGINSLFMPKDNATDPLMAIVPLEPSSPMHVNAGGAYDRVALLAANKPLYGPVLHVVGVTDGSAPALSNILASVPLASYLSDVLSLSTWDASFPRPTVDTIPVLLTSSTGRVLLYQWSPANASLSALPVQTTLNITTSALGAEFLSGSLACTSQQCYAVATVSGGLIAGGISVAVYPIPAASTAYVSAVATAPVQNAFAVTLGASLAFLPVAGTGTDSTQLTGVLIYATGTTLNATQRLARSRVQTYLHSRLQGLVEEHCDLPAGAPLSARRVSLSQACNMTALRGAWREVGAKHGTMSVQELDEVLSASLAPFTAQAQGQAHSLRHAETATAGRKALADGSVGDLPRPEMFGAIVDLTVATGTGTGIVSLTVSWNGQEGLGGGTPERIGLGSAPHVTGTVYSGVPVVLVVNTDGMCQCGLLQNNDNTPKCLLPTAWADDNALFNLYQSVQYLLNYNYGSLDAFTRMITGAFAPSTPNGAGTNSQYFSMCHPEIASGKFENGVSPTGALFTRQVVYQNSTEAPNGGPVAELALLVAHDGDVLPPITTDVVCGSSVYKGGVVFDQFRLLQPNEL